MLWLIEVRLLQQERPSHDAASDLRGDSNEIIQSQSRKLNVKHLLIVEASSYLLLLAGKRNESRKFYHVLSVVFKGVWWQLS